MGALGRKVLYGVPVPLCWALLLGAESLPRHWGRRGMPGGGQGSLRLPQALLQPVPETRLSSVLSDLWKGLQAKARLL